MAKTTVKRPSPGSKAQREAKSAQGAVEKHIHQAASTRKATTRKAATRKATNLTLDPAAVTRAEAYRARYGMGSLSQLVNALLAALPSAEGGLPAPSTLAPAVRRLLGVARPSVGAGDAAIRADDDPRAAYRAHLVDKYGGAA